MDCDEELRALREAAQELLGADEDYRKAPTMPATSRLVRARRQVEELLAEEPAQ